MKAGLRWQMGNDRNAWTRAAMTFPQEIVNTSKQAVDVALVILWNKQLADRGVYILDHQLSILS